MIRIQSTDNPRIRLVRKLASRKGRTSEGKFTAEGINLVREAVSRGLELDFVMVPDGRRSSEIEEIVRTHDDIACEVPGELFEKLTDAEYGAGILAVVRMPVYDSGMICDLEPECNILVLDRIQDPGNIGTMIRTAVACGYSMVIAVKGTADIYSAKVLRATAGMVFDIPFIYVNDATELGRLLRSAGKRIVVTDPAGGRPYYEEDLAGNTALVIGNEGNGISSEVMELADIRVTLPMKGGVESLNAAVSAAILMYEAVRN